MTTWGRCGTTVARPAHLSSPQAQSHGAPSVSWSDARGNIVRSGHSCETTMEISPGTMKRVSDCASRTLRRGGTPCGADGVWRRGSQEGSRFIPCRSSVPYRVGPPFVPIVFCRADDLAGSKVGAQGDRHHALTVDLSKANGPDGSRSRQLKLVHDQSSLSSSPVFSHLFSIIY